MGMNSKTTKRSNNIHIASRIDKQTMSWLRKHMKKHGISKSAAIRECIMLQALV